MKVPKGTNEITIAPSLLSLISFKDAIVAGDAMHAQKKNVEVIVSNSGDYLFTIKRNQHQLYKDVALYLDDLFDNRPSDVLYSLHESSERSRGRKEHRVCLSTSNIGWLYQRRYWPKLRSISVIQSTRTINGVTTTQRRYFISSLKADSVSIMKIIRDHWRIENLCHRHLDVDFASDWATLRDDNAALNLSILKDFCLSLLKNCYQVGSIKSRRCECAFRVESLIKSLLN
jgi:predicted transposase YbfD/YdcC